MWPAATELEICGLSRGEPGRVQTLPRSENYLKLDQAEKHCKSRVGLVSIPGIRVFLKTRVSFVIWTGSGHPLKLFLVSVQCFGMKGTEQLSNSCISKLVFHSKLGNCTSVKESFSLGMVDVCRDLGVDTSLTAMAFSRISIPVLESNVLHRVCKCVFPHHSDSFCKNVRLSFCLFRFLPVDLKVNFLYCWRGILYRWCYPRFFLEWDG